MVELILQSVAEEQWTRGHKEAEGQRSTTSRAEETEERAHWETGPAWYQVSFDLHKSAIITYITFYVILGGQHCSSD